MPRTIRSRWKFFMISKLWKTISHQFRKCFYSVITCTSSQVKFALDGLIHLLFTIFFHIKPLNLRIQRMVQFLKLMVREVKPYHEYQSYKENIIIDLSDPPNLKLFPSLFNDLTFCYFFFTNLFIFY